MTKKIYLKLALLLCSCSSLVAQNDVSFSFQAHQDDWQLFMSSRIMSDLTAVNGKVVFITLTAGDAGNGTVSYGAIPFYQARERGAVYSSKVAADIATGTAPLAVPTATTVTFNGHNIAKYVYKNTVNYFFRLPDGGGSGNGFPLTGDRSLRKLKLGTITSLSAVDGSAIYNSWANLVTTVRNILTFERGTDNQVWVYKTSPNTTFNAGDHSDHVYSGIAANDAFVDSLWVGIVEFSNYNSASSPANLSNTDHENSSVLFATVSEALSENLYTGVYDEGHKSWLAMDISNVVRAPSGTASRAGSGSESGEGLSNNIQPGNLTFIPMVLKVSSPVLQHGSAKIVLNPNENGILLTEVVGSDGVVIKKLEQTVTAQKLVEIQLEGVFTAKGIYAVKHTLNNKYTETKKITVQ